MKKSKSWQINLGQFLFKYRSFTPVPLIIIVFIFFKPNLPNKTGIIVTLAGLLFTFFGEMIRIISVGYSYSGTSGRENYLRADNLNIEGIYSIVRNPLYIGNFFVFTGLLMVYSNLIAVLLFDFFIIIQYHFIISAEEHYLMNKYGTDYENYCKRVSRIIPSIKSYKKTELKFNLKKTIFQEKSSILNLLTMLLVILAYKENVVFGKIKNLLIYIISLSILIGIYLILKVLKKRIQK